jgi:enoyl-CoA hydratase/carnithine racemase
MESPKGVKLIRLECGKANAIDEPFLDSLLSELEGALQSRQRAIVITGYANYFSAGLNLTGLPDTRGGNARLRREIRSSFSSICFSSRCR